MPQSQAAQTNKMLQIFVYGQEEGFLDVDPGTVLDMEALSPIFDEDQSSGDFSLPFDLTWTDNNRRKLGFAERMENKSVKKFTYRVHVFENGFLELANAKLTILTKAGRFDYLKGKFSVSISGTKGLFYSRIKDKYLQDLPFDLVDYAGSSSRVFATNVMKGLLPDLPFLAFAPVAILNFFDTSRSDYNNEFLCNETANNIVGALESTHDWEFGRPDPDHPDEAIDPEDPLYVDYRTIPFFKLKHVLQLIFSANGFTVTGEFFTSTDFDDVFIFNNFSLEVYDLAFYRDLTHSINPSNHLPKMLIKDFLHAVYSWANIYPIYGRDTVELRYRVKTLASKRIYKASGLVAKDFESTYAEQSESSGYKVKYEWDNADSYFNDRVKDLTTSTIAGTVVVRSLLDSLDIGRPFTTDDIVYVEAENMYYKVADATGIPVVWEAFSEGLDEYIYGEGGNEFAIKLSTLCRYVVQNSESGLYQVSDYLGCDQKGSYRNNKNVQVLNDFGLRLFYLKKKQIGDALVPNTFNHNRADDNTLVLPFSFATAGSNNIVDALHKDWIDLKESMEIMKTDMCIDKKILTEMDAADKFEIDNIIYLPYKVERSLPLPNDNSGKVSLVPM